MRWQDCTGSLGLCIDDQVTQQDPRAEYDERAEETCHKSDPCRQVVDLVGTEKRVAVKIHSKFSVCGREISTSAENRDQWSPVLHQEKLQSTHLNGTHSKGERKDKN
jgi:hypothetical protein